MLTITSTVTLNNGVEMPVFGFGTWQLRKDSQALEATRAALETGYRLIDTATAYDNEHSVGAAIRESGLDRREVFITTKVREADQGEAETQAAFRASLERLGTEYIDLYLIHWPAAGRWQGAWRAMLSLLDGGQCRAIGVSNFMIHHLLELCASSPRTPAVDQVPFNPFEQQRDLHAYCREHGIAFAGYSPLRDINLRDARLAAIAAKHGKTPAQVLLRWSLQHGAITIPKSAHPQRIRENADLFDFELDARDMTVIDGFGQ